MGQLLSILLLLAVMVYHGYHLWQKVSALYEEPPNSADCTDQNSGLDPSDINE